MPESDIAVVDFDLARTWDYLLSGRPDILIVQAVVILGLALLLYLFIEACRYDQHKRRGGRSDATNPGNDGG